MRFTSWGVNFTVEQASEFVLHCLDCGITVFDTADIYGHHNEVETLLGQV
jgi:aryl-alcohol dehydrogenase-like predicted oxidoreductase